MAKENTNGAMHIAIAGNIGSGKTTLAGLLSKHYIWDAHFEDVDDNPYLNDFYEDMQRWSFNLQVYFLNSRLNQILKIRKSGKTVIQDRTIYEDAYIFAPNLHSMGLMSTRDFENYFTLFRCGIFFSEPPFDSFFFSGVVCFSLLEVFLFCGLSSSFRTFTGASFGQKVFSSFSLVQPQIAGSGIRQVT